MQNVLLSHIIWLLLMHSCAFHCTVLLQLVHLQVLLTVLYTVILSFNNASYF